VTNIKTEVNRNKASGHTHYALNLIRYIKIWSVF